MSRKQINAMLFLAMLAVGHVDAVSRSTAAVGMATLAIAAHGARDDVSQAISVHSAGRQVLAHHQEHDAQTIESFHSSAPPTKVSQGATEKKHGAADVLLPKDIQEVVRGQGSLLHTVRQDETFTLMQFNMLADGLATDGFMSPRQARTRTTADSPDTPNIPLKPDDKHTFYNRVRDTVKGIQEVKLSDIPRWQANPKANPKVMVAEALADKDGHPWGIKAMVAQKKQEAVNEAWVVSWAGVSNKGLAEADLQEKANQMKLPGGRLWTKHEMDAHQGRLQRLAGIVREKQPDVITIQEIDMFSDVARELGAQGYVAWNSASSLDTQLVAYGKLKKDRNGAVQQFLTVKKALKKIIEKINEKKKEKADALERAEEADEAGDSDEDQWGDVAVEDPDLIVVPNYLDLLETHEEGGAIMGILEMAMHKEIQAGTPLKDMEPKSVMKVLDVLLAQHYKESLDALASAGFAFAPKLNSHARKFGGYGSHDDDGCAIFWKKDKFTATEFNHALIGTDPNHGGKADAPMLLVGLQHTDSGKTVFVTTTHLSSGPEKEARRHSELADVASLAMKKSGALVFAADLNSDVFYDLEQPQCKCPGLKTTCFGLITSETTTTFDETIKKGKANLVQPGWGLQSIWGSGTLPIPPSVIKMRGPGTDQPHKMGTFALETIDHVFYSGNLTLLGVDVVGVEAWFKMSPKVQRLLKRMAAFPSQVGHLVDGIRTLLTPDSDGNGDKELMEDDAAEKMVERIALLDKEQGKLSVEGAGLMRLEEDVAVEVRTLLNHFNPTESFDTMAEALLLPALLKEVFWRMAPNVVTPSDHFPVIATLMFA